MKHYRDETLIDLLGDRQNEVAEANKKLKQVKEELQRRGLTKGEGTRFSFTCTKSHSNRLDSKKVRSMLSAALLSQCLKTVCSTQWHIHARVVKKEARSAKAA